MTNRNVVMVWTDERGVESVDWRRGVSLVEAVASLGLSCPPARLVMHCVSDECADLLDLAADCEGAEVHRDSWPAAEHLVSLGLAVLSHQRGPDGDWRRIALMLS